MVMGLGRGPINELVEIRVGGKLAWFGSATTSGRYFIKAGKLFGGDKGEGGIDGSFDLCMGEKTQGQNARVVGLRGALVSAMRGVAVMVYDGLICSLNPYPKEWKMRVRRTTAGWDQDPWYPERAAIYFLDNVTTLDTPTVDVGFIGDPGEYSPAEWQLLYYAKLAELQASAQLTRRLVCSMNPAHMLIEIATNHEWGRGMPMDQIDLNLYKVAADNLYCEGFGMCLRWNRQSSLDDLVGEIISTIGGMQYVSRTTGLLTLRLLRNDYVVEDLPVFSRDGGGVLSIESDEASGSEAGFNEVVVKYRSALTGDVAAVRYHNLGSITSDGGVNSTTTDYLGIADRNIAVRVAARDVKSNTGDLRRLKLTLDRRGYPLEPGVPFILSDPESGIESMVMRSVTITNEDFVSGTITLTCLTDVFGLPDTVYVGAEDAPTDLPSTAPALPLDQRLLEIPYRSIYQNTDSANFSLLTDDVAFLGAAAIRPNFSNTSYDLIYKSHSAAEYLPEDEVPGEWCASLLLPNTLSPLEELITFTGVSLEEISVGLMALIDNEEVQVTTIDEETLTITIARGCLDTVPVEHAAGARMWFYETGETSSNKEFTLAEQVDGKILSNAESGTLSPGLAQELTLTMVGRFGKPYPPGKVQIDGEDIFLVQSIASGATLTWARRNRITQADVVQDFHVADITPEAGQTTTVRTYRQDTNALLEEYTGITGTSQVLTPGYVGVIRVEVSSVRDGLESHQKYAVVIGSDNPYMTTITGEFMTTVSGEYLTTGA
jgi:hypothetical protein